MKKPLYHIVDSSTLEIILRVDEYKPKSLASDGFIHLAYEEQLDTILKFFTGPSDVFLLKLDARKLIHDVIDEATLGSDQSTTLYPHLYGSLNTTAIAEVHKVQLDLEGNIQQKTLLK